MAYFEIKSNLNLRPEITSVRKDAAYRLLDIARVIQEDGHREGVNFFVNKNQVTANQYADEVFRVYAEYDKKFKDSHKRVWIQQGVCGNSGYHKWIKAA